MSFRLLVKFFYGNKALYVFAVIIYVVLTYAILYSVTQYKNYTYKIELAEQAKYDQDIFIQLKLGSFGRNENLEKEYQAAFDLISEIDGVESFTCAQTFDNAALTSDYSKQLLLDILTDLKHGNAKYKLMSGTWPDEPNEVVLASKARNHYQIGEIIQMQMETYPSLVDNREPAFVMKDVELKITGFLDDSAQVLYYGRGDENPTLDTFFISLGQFESGFGGFSDENELCVDGIIFQPTSKDGESITSSGEGAKYILRLEDPSEAEQIAAQLEGKIPGKTIIGKELLSEYRATHQVEISTSLRNVILVLALCVCGTLLTVNLSIRKRNQEICLLAICGVSPTRIIGLFYLTFIPVILISWVIGLITFLISIESGSFVSNSLEKLIFFPQDMVLCLVFLLLTTTLFMLPSFLISSSRPYLSDLRKE